MQSRGTIREIGGSSGSEVEMLIELFCRYRCLSIFMRDCLPLQMLGTWIAVLGSRLKYGTQPRQ